MKYAQCLRVVCISMLGLCCSQLLAAPPGAASAPVYWVNDPGDAPDALPGNGVCATGPVLPGTGRLACTLRAAITEANLDGAPSVIAFEICPSDFAPNPDGSHTIFPGPANLPALFDPATGGYTYINGYTQGYPQPGNPPYDDPAVPGPIACNGPIGVPPRVASPNGGLFGDPLTTRLGIIVDGTFGAPVPGPGALTPVPGPIPGAFVPSGSIVPWGAPTGASTGFTILDNRNVIAGLNIRNFENAGILIMPEPTGIGAAVPPYENVVWGNYIGTDIDGIDPMGNRFGVEIIGRSTGNYVGDTFAIRTWGLPDPAWREEPTSDERNLISGNDNHPVPDVFHSYGDLCDQGPPPGSGIPFHDDGAGVFLGVDPCIRVTSSAFPETVDIVLGGAVDNHVRNNYIGTNFEAKQPIPNSNGVWLNYDAGRGTAFREPAGFADYPGNHIGGCLSLPFVAGPIADCVPNSDSEQDGNLISGNARRLNGGLRPDQDGGHGVWINGAPDPYFTNGAPSAVHNEIGGNLIGTDGPGFDKLPNGGNGVYMQTGVFAPPGPPIANNEVGATTEFVPGLATGYFAPAVFGPIDPFAYRYPNLISGNGDPADVHPLGGTFDHGVEIRGEQTFNNWVAYGNVIGLMSSGIDPLGNGGSGVMIHSAAKNNLVHNNSPAAISSIFSPDDFPSLSGAISGNGDFGVFSDAHGVFLSGTDTRENHVFRNCIGSTATDCEPDYPGNRGSGVFILGGAAANLIGQSFIGSGPEGNWIHHNDRDGVSLRGPTSDFNAIRYNSIWRNGDPAGIPGAGNLGIDLNDDDDTPNDPGDIDSGPNEEQNYPAPTLGFLSPFEVRFTSCAGCAVDLYANLLVESDFPVNNGEGRFWLTSAAGTGAAQLINIQTEITTLFGIAPPPLCITLTATDSANNTSEFSPCVDLPAGAVPNGTSVSGSQLLLDKNAILDLTLSWDNSCRSTDVDYGIYEGTIGGTFNSHSSLLCSTGGATTITFTPSAGSSYYLVVPQNATREGSYGIDSSGIDRPVGTAVCLPQDWSCP